MAIFRDLDEREITDPRAIGEALGTPAQEANGLLTRHRWREGDVELLEVAGSVDGNFLQRLSAYVVLARVHDRSLGIQDIGEPEEPVAQLLAGTNLGHI